MAPKLKRKADDYEFDVSRYSPRAKFILKDSVAGVLDPTAFSTVKGVSVSNSNSSSSAPNSGKAAPVSLRNKGVTATPISASNSGSTSIPSRSVVLFVIGGVTYSEIRSAYEVAEATKRESYIGKKIGLFFKKA